MYIYSILATCYISISLYAHTDITSSNNVYELNSFLFIGIGCMYGTLNIFLKYITSNKKIETGTYAMKSMIIIVGKWQKHVG